jgi:serine/threonine protein kinase
VTYVCSACRRSFAEPGFCPHDGTQLVDAQVVAAQTLLSTVMAAQANPVTEVDPRRGTFPMTPTPPASAHTQDVTSARTRVVPAEPPAPRELRALSASEDPAAALASMRAGKGESEYDRLVGQTLDGRYFVERKIGEGGMGVVFSARHAVIERPLAIKVLKREVMRDTATIKRFVKEAQAASRIGHPNIVDVTDFGTTPDGMTFSVMEYVDGQTLGSTLRHSAPFPMQRAIRVTVQIARALGAAHDKGIVHRDLKPENVFLIDRDDRPDFVKIVDFGIAKVAALPGAANPNEPRLTRAGSVFGTPEYMAPEQAAGRSDTDGRVDIYALGVILYEMLIGRVPHRGDSTVRTLAMVMLDPVDPPRKVRPELDISEELEAIVLKALAKKRELRYQKMHELIAALEKLQTPVGLSVTGSPVYALTPLPPGADPSLLEQTAPSMVPPRIKQRTPPPATNNVASETVDDRGSPRSRAPTNRIKDEPQFVTREKPITFEHVFTDGGLPAQKRLWPYMLLFGLILGGAAVAAVLLVKSRPRGLARRRERYRRARRRAGDHRRPTGEGRAAGHGHHAEWSRHDLGAGDHEARGRDALQRHHLLGARRHERRAAVRLEARAHVQEARLQDGQRRDRVRRQDRVRPLHGASHQALHRQHQESVRRLRARSFEARPRAVIIGRCRARRRRSPRTRPRHHP